MRFSTSWAALTLLWPLCSLTVACGDDPVLGSTGPAGAGGGNTGGNASGGNGGGEGGGDGGTDDVPCTPTSATAIEIYPGSAGIQVDQLARVGARWVAGGTDGFVYFDEDGANADQAPLALGPYWNVIGAEGDNVGVVATSDFAVQYQRLDDAGDAVTGVRGLAQQSPVGVTLASDGGNTLVVWAFNTRLYGRGVDRDGFVAGDVFDVANGAFSTYVGLAAAGRNGEIGVAWSGDATVGTNEIFFTRAGMTASIAAPRSVFEGSGQHTVVGVAATSAGYVIAATGPGPDYRPLLVAVTPEGEVEDVVHLQGAQHAHGIASNGDRIAVATGTEDGRPQVRVFDAKLAPRGGWQCYATAHIETATPSVAVEDDGFAVLHTSAAGAVVLHHMGTLEDGR